MDVGPDLPSALFEIEFLVCNCIVPHELACSLKVSVSVSLFALEAVVYIGMLLCLAFIIKAELHRVLRIQTQVLRHAWPALLPLNRFPMPCNGLLNELEKSVLCWFVPSGFRNRISLR